MKTTRCLVRMALLFPRTDTERTRNGPHETSRHTSTETLSRPVLVWQLGVRGASRIGVAIPGQCILRAKRITLGMRMRAEHFGANRPSDRSYASV